MSLTVILLCVLAALVELDNTSVGQLGFGRAFISGIIFGFLTGDTWTGLQLGAFIELLFMDYTPVGGVLPPNGTIAAFCAVMANFFGWPVYFAFAFGVAAGLAFRYVELFLRKISGRYLHSNSANLIMRPVPTMRKFIAGTLAFQLLINFILIALTVFILKNIIFHTPQIHYRLEASFKFAYICVPWMGLMLLLKKFTFKAR